MTRRRMEGEGGWGEEVDLWKFGGPAESTHRGLLRAKGEGGGLGKTWTRRGPIPRRSLISDFERRTRREPPSPFAIVLQG